MDSYGHYGRASWFVAGLAVAALLLHFAVPFGVVEYRGPASPDNEMFWRGDVTEQRSYFSDSLLVNNASPTVTLAGAMLAVFGGVLLLVLGFQPLQVGAARWIGYGGGALACLGAGLMWMSSMYAVGTGFATFLGTVMGTGFQAQFWAVSPLLVAAASMAILWYAGQVMTTVVSSRDGLRDRARGHLADARMALVLMGTVLVVPWSLGLLPDGVSDFLGTDFGDDPAPLWFSAEDVQSVTVSEGADGGRIRYGQSGDFGALSFALHTFLALSWAAYVWHLLWPAAAVAVSTGKKAGLLRTADLGALPVALLWALAGVLYVVAWVLFKPNGEVEETFLPGFWPLLALLPAWLLLRRHLPVLKSFMSGQDAPARATDLDA